MILYLSSAFLLRLRLIWTPDFKGFLLGDRNLYFFAPDAPVNVPEITPQRIDAFLSQKMADNQDWELLGFLSPEEQEPFPGYVQLHTKGVLEPEQWEAKIYFLEESGVVSRPVQIKIPGT